MSIDVQRGMIRSLYFSILVLALFSAGIGIAAAADPIVSITPSQSSVCVGDDFDVYVQVDPNGNTLEMAQVDLAFDSSLVSLTVANGGMFSTLFDAGTQSGDTVTDITGLDPGVTATGNLAVLHIHADSAGTFTLDLSDVTAGTATATLTPAVNNGTVTINVCNDPIISIIPSQSSVCVGDDFDVYIQVNPNGTTLEMAQVDLAFDSSLVSLTVANGGMFSTLFSAGTQSGDTVTDISGLDQDVTATGNLAVLHMHADSAGTFTLGLSNATAGTATATLTPAVNNGTVTINVCCIGDLNNDGFVNFADVLLIIGAWGACAGCPEDLDGDEFVNIADVLIVVANWGQCP